MCSGMVYSSCFLQVTRNAQCQVSVIMVCNHFNIFFFPQESYMLYFFFMRKCRKVFHLAPKFVLYQIYKNPKNQYPTNNYTFTVIHYFTHFTSNFELFFTVLVMMQYHILERFSQRSTGCIDFLEQRAITQDIGYGFVN